MNSRDTFKKEDPNGFDFNLNNKMNHFQICSTGGSCGSTGLCLIDEHSRESLTSVGLYPVNVVDDGYGIGTTTATTAFSKAGKLYAALGKDPDFWSLAEVSDSGLIILCEYQKKFKSWLSPSEKNDTCNSFANKKYEDVASEQSESDDPINQQFPKWLGYFKAKFPPVDIKNDGSKISLASINYEKTRGCYVSASTRNRECGQPGCGYSDRCTFSVSWLCLRILSAK
jgi:hypothetical protein